MFALFTDGVFWHKSEIDQAEGEAIESGAGGELFAELLAKADQNVF